MQHILVPTDFSEMALNAYRYALSVAEKYSARITLLHVYHFPVIDPYMPGSMIESINSEQQGKALEQFSMYEGFAPEKISPHIKSGVKIDHVLRTGFVVAEIVRLVDELDIDLIVMGTGGASGLSETLLGSNTVSVIEHVQIPVLAIPEKAEFNAIQKIAYASDFEKSEFKALSALIKFAMLSKATIRCVHIKTDDSIWDDVHFDDWHEYYWNEVKSGVIKFEMIEDEDVLSGLNSYIKQNDIDLLAMVTHKKSVREKLFGKSLTKKMAFHSSIPIWAFHA